MASSEAILAAIGQVALRSIGLAALAVVLIALLRLKSAAAQHAVWTAVAAGMLLMAAVSPLLPPVTLRILHVGARAANPAPAAAASPSDAALPPAVPPSPGPGSRSIPWEQVAAGLYAAGVALFLLRLASSYRFTRQLVRASRDAGAHGACESDWISVPVTVGVLRPKILLPAEWRNWPPEKLAAVMAHEQVHVTRADWAIAAMAGLNRCLFWFHPLAWWIERRLAVLAEHACDDAALLELGKREPYAEALLDMAAAVRTGRGRLVWEAMAMAKTAEVKKRINRILDESREIPRAWTRKRWAALAMCGVPLLYLAAAVQLAPARQQAPAAQPDRQAQFRAETIYDPAQGVYLPPGSAAVPAVFAPRAAVPVQENSQAFDAIRPPVLLYKKEAPYTPDAIRAQLQGAVVLSVLVGADGQARVVTVSQSLGLGLDQNAIQAVEQWKFKPATQNGQPVDCPVTVTVNFRLVSPPAAAAPAQQAPTTFRASTAPAATRGASAQDRSPSAAPAAADAIQPPVLLSKREAEYSDEALKAKYQGTVVLAVTVGSDGHVYNPKVLRSLGLGLDENAVAAVEQWLFRPASRNGQAVDSQATVEVNFRLASSAQVAQTAVSLSAAIPGTAAPRAQAQSGQVAFRSDTTYDPSTGEYVSTAPRPSPVVNFQPRPSTQPAANIIPAVLLHKIEPEYTEEARAAKYQGTAVLAVTIATDGSAQNIRVIRSLGLGLDEKAIEAVKQWIFKPAYRDGKPVESDAQLEVNFRLLPQR